MQLVVLVGFGWTSWVWLGIIFKFESLNRDWYSSLAVTCSKLECKNLICLHLSRKLNDMFQKNHQFRLHCVFLGINCLNNSSLVS